MNRQDLEGLVVLFNGLTAGLAFVWLFGFAVGYQDPITPAVLFALAVSSFVYSRILANKKDTLG